ncbi:MAG: branched-chain amino acid transaminase [Kiritimatiellia bacterium]|jgi:branched-chain amino acid aminotransferase|nr:branched-chain amino acid transaminase [Kiritimatiellia bacterium]MDP6810664.1 branched-chain amino acid transaminase [Kiritimatiellia bacterium]MDP7023750.1 branched-chain amino acid transaminase [Kiritimatiellia bacterium]
MSFGQGKIWYDGKLVDWADATCHVMAHALHYGSSVFEGIRCYDTGKGPGIFRLSDHMRRLHESAKIYRMEIPFDQAELEQAVIDTVKANNLSSCYIRPLAFRGLGAMGVNPKTCPVNVVIAAWSWGKYLGEEAMEAGVSVRVSSWRRPAPDTFPTMAKAGGNYLNSQLIKMEATEDGFDEGIALDHYGFVSEGSGENIFMVRNGVIYTPPTSSSILPGITRHCVVTLARELGYTIRQQVIPREALYVADEVFFSGTAAEITPVSKIDNLVIGNGKRGPITEKVQSAFFDIVEGRAEDTHGWFTPVV